MKKILSALCISLVFASCSSDPCKPTATINGMVDAMKSGNIDAMKKYISKSDLALLEAGEAFLTNIDPEAVKKIKERMAEEFKERSKTVSFKLKNEKINGDNATVDGEVSADGKTESHTFQLVKEDGDWKIAISKPGNEIFNSMKGNLGRDKGDLKQGFEKLKEMNQDSLKALLRKGLQALDSMKAKE